MKLKFDILINAILPILIGVVVYRINFTGFIRNYLPDGLWAYAFVSTILITWQRKLIHFWLFIIGLSFITFEMLQYHKIIKGTGDFSDVLVYLIFGLAAILFNPIFKNNLKLKYNYDNKT